jgi:putative transposase
METSIRLSKSEKEYLSNFVKSGKRNAKEIEHAYILLALNKKKPISAIIDFYEASRTTIWRIKSKYIENGLDAALTDAPRSGQPSKYSDKGEAEIVALACTQAPTGRARWTLRLMEQELRKRDELKTVNRETIRLVLKKRNVSLG